MTTDLMEEHTLLAWQPLALDTVNGWQLRFANSFTKRANSVQLIDAGGANLREKFDFIESAYQKHRVPPTLRVVPAKAFTAIAHQRAFLTFAETRGYQTIDLSSVLWKKTNSSHCLHDSMALNQGIDEIQGKHLQIYRDTDYVAEELLPELHGLLLRSKLTVRQFVRIDKTGRMIASAFGIFDAQLMGIYEFVVHRDFRQQGLGKALLHDMESFAAKGEIPALYLQVLNNNRPALKLYTGNGFDLVYTYYYMTRQ